MLSKELEYYYFICCSEFQAGDGIRSTKSYYFDSSKRASLLSTVYALLCLTKLLLSLYVSKLRANCYKKIASTLVGLLL